MSLNQQFREVVPEYKEALRKRGTNDESQEQYVLHAEKIIEYLDAVYSNQPPSRLEHINDEHILRFLNWKGNEQKVSEVTLDMYYKAAKYFFRFMYDEKGMRILLMHNVGSPLKNRNELDRDFDFFSQEELNEIIATAQNQWQKDSDYFKHRNYVITYLFCYAGLTVKEMTLLKKEDIDVEKRLLHIHQGRQRQIQLSSQAVNLLDNYLREEVLNGSSKLFLSKNGTSLSTRAIQDALKLVIQESSVECAGRKPSPSTIRHSVIKLMFEAKIEWPIIKNITGLEYSSLVKYVNQTVPYLELKESLYLEEHPVIRSS